MFRRVRIVIVKPIIAIVLLFPATLPAKELPFLADFSKLRLKIVNTEVFEKLPGVEAINNAPLGDRFLPRLETSYYTAPEGKKIVVVTLKGKIPYPCQFTYNSDEFSALYEVTATNAAGEKETRTIIDYAVGVTMDDSWLISTEGSRTSSVQYFDTAPLILKIAYYLPKEVTSFFVRYPAIIPGKAVISQQKGKKSR